MKFFYSVWIAFLLGLAILAGANGLGWANWLIVPFASLSFGWMIARDLWQYHNDELQERGFLYETRTKFIIAMTTTTSEHRQFLAVEWPELGVEFGTEHIVYILKDGANTGILMDFFRKFLEDSNDREFVDLRNYNDDKYLQKRFDCSRDYVRAEWNKATEFLKKIGYLKVGSMAGSHSYQWTSKQHYSKLVRRYSVVPQFADMGEQSA